MSETTPLLARQPIFDGDMKVVAYELLCRNKDLKFIATSDGDAASSEVLLNAFNELSIEDVIGTHKAFVNFTRALLNSMPPCCFPCKTCAIKAAPSHWMCLHY